MPLSLSLSENSPTPFMKNTDLPEIFFFWTDVLQEIFEDNLK